ncbi:phosphotransferase family protein [Haladaptatus sp. DYSN1]|uniref:phosphotransferase family protein n=1 Tax=unclassified Haladaptatus TaxID=2622732 RepID=UPI002404BD57|nr:aminoglycoside phosphotransferase family protein [Haladaptatus sp. DYSN1]
MAEDHPSSERTTLSPKTAVSYLRRHDVLTDGEDATAESLGGGVSNAVVKVEAGDEAYVLKQPHPNLAVEDDWPADVSRVHNEAAAARAYDSILANGAVAGLRVPGVATESHDDHIIVIDCAPDGATMWKTDLLAGTVDASVAHRLGQFLGTAHRVAAGRPDIRERFADKTPFDQLRVDPYHRTTAKHHPELEAPILAEAERVLAADRTLVHGDFSPKNVLVNPGTDALWVLDFEVAHWGDPAFDTGFMLNHLCIKAVHVASHREEFLDAALAFWEAYTDAAGWDVERDTTAELAVLMLARVDGKSPVEYTDAETEATLRRIATRALREPVERVPAFVELVREEAR